MKFERKDILGIKDLSVDEINLILETAESFLEISTREIKKVPTLRGKTIINLFSKPAPEQEHLLKLPPKDSAPILLTSPLPPVPSSKEKRLLIRHAIWKP